MREAKDLLPPFMHAGWNFSGYNSFLGCSKQGPLGGAYIFVNLRDQEKRVGNAAHYTNKGLQIIGKHVEYRSKNFLKNLSNEKREFEAMMTVGSLFLSPPLWGVYKKAPFSRSFATKTSISQFLEEEIPTRGEVASSLSSTHLQSCENLGIESVGVPCRFGRFAFHPLQQENSANFGQNTGLFKFPGQPMCKGSCKNSESSPNISKEANQRLHPMWCVGILALQRAVYAKRAASQRVNDFNSRDSFNLSGRIEFSGLRGTPSMETRSEASDIPHKQLSFPHVEGKTSIYSDFSPLTSVWGKVKKNLCAAKIFGENCISSAYDSAVKCLQPSFRRMSSIAQPISNHPHSSVVEDSRQEFHGGRMKEYSCGRMPDNEQFSSVFSSPASTDLPQIDSSAASSDFSFQQEDVCGSSAHLGRSKRLWLASVSSLEMKLTCLFLGGIISSVEDKLMSFINKERFAFLVYDLLRIISLLLRPLNFLTAKPALCEAGLMQEHEERPTFSPIGKAPAVPVSSFNTTSEAVKRDLKAEIEDDSSPSLAKNLNLRDADVVIYQFESCPFCRKVRACLDLYKIPYRVAEVHPLRKTELNFTGGYKKVPVLLVRDKSESGKAKPIPYTLEELQSDPTAVYLTDSKRIVAKVMKHQQAEGVCMTAEEKEAELSWIQWTDNWLVQLIVMNIYRSYSESAEAFNYLLTHPHFGVFDKHLIRISGLVVMKMVADKRKKQFNVKDERKALYEALNTFIEQVGDNDFLGGDKPNGGDIAVYGILRSIEGFRTEKDVFEHTNINAWYNRMAALTGESFAINKIKRGPEAS